MEDDPFEVKLTLRAFQKNRVVILTSSIQEKDLTEGYRLGVNSYLKKPVGFGRFQEAVR